MDHFRSWVIGIHSGWLETVSKKLTASFSTCNPKLVFFPPRDALSCVTILALMDKHLSDSALVCASTSADLITLGKTLYHNSPFSPRMWKTLFQKLQVNLMCCRLAHHYLLGKVSIHLQLETFTFGCKTCDTLN